MLKNELIVQAISKGEILLRSRKAIALGIAAAFFMVISTGCSKSYTCADIEGTWTNHVLEFDQEWTFNADGTYTEKSVMDGEYLSYEGEDSGKFHFEGDMIIIESDDEIWGNNSTFKVEIIDKYTMTWETEAGKIREFKKL